MTLCRPGRPDCRWYWRAIFTAVSTPSEPPETKYTRAAISGFIATSASASCSCHGLVNVAP